MPIPAPAPTAKPQLMVEVVGTGAPPAKAGPWAKAERHLRRDPALKPLIKRIGPCTLVPVEREPYEALVRAIAHQQVHGRRGGGDPRPLPGAAPGACLPAARGGAGDEAEAMRACGFSQSKVAAIRDIAEKAAGGPGADAEGCARFGDAELIERLVAIRGVGRWTVEMLLIFTLAGRTCCRSTISECGRAGRSRRAGGAAQAEGSGRDRRGWAPWRSVAAWYLWRAADAAKRSAFKPQ
jgi:DNA-3-methyladenine glycosylase II